MLQHYIQGEANERVCALPLMVDFGVINGDLSLKTNSYPVNIPVGAYQVCRQLTLGKVNTVLTKTKKDGKHIHNAPAVSSALELDSEHEHEVLIPEKMRSIKAGDNVLVVWVGNDAVVVDIILPAKEAFK